jgi:hypothetical protein
MELECYPTENRPPEIVPGRPQRAWMDHFADRHPYRCLPLTMANTTGWDILCPVGFSATWDGGAHQRLHHLQGRPSASGLRRLREVALLARHRHLPHRISVPHPAQAGRSGPWGRPITSRTASSRWRACVETDWLPFPFTMNWMFTRPGTVRFEKGEPFCFFMMIQDKPLEQVQPVIRSMNSNPDLRKQYDVWAAQRGEFNARSSSASRRR